MSIYLELFCYWKPYEQTNPQKENTYSH